MSDTYSGPEALVRAMGGGRCTYRYWSNGEYLFYDTASGFKRHLFSGKDIELMEASLGSIAQDLEWWSDYIEPAPRWRLRDTTTITQWAHGAAGVEYWELVAPNGDTATMGDVIWNDLFERIDE